MNWLIQSRKAQVAIGGVLTIVLSRLLKHFGFSDSDINVISGSVLTVATIWIHSIAHEDAAAKSGPQNQTNVNSDVTNAPTPPAPAAKPEPFTPDQLDFIFQQIRQRAQRSKSPEPPKPTQAA